MNTKLLPIILIVAGFSSCSTAYKAGQTPDDVYYSPVRPQNDYVRTEKDEDRTVYHDNTIYSDPTIRTRAQYRRWRRYNDYDYNYPYGNQYPPIYIDPKSGKSAPAPRKVTLGAYKKPADKTTPDPVNVKGGNVTPSTTPTAPVRTFKQPVKTTAVGNFIRDLFSGKNQIDMDNATNNSRTFSNSNNNSNSSNSNSNTNSNTNSGSSNSNSGSSSGSGSSAPVRTFDKK